MIHKRTYLIGFIDPRWFRDFGHKTVVGTVKDQKIEVGGQFFKFESDPFPEGSEVYLTVGSGSVVLKAEYDSHIEGIKRRVEEEKEKLVVASNLKKEEAIAFNKQFEKLPFKWEVGIKTVLSGLTENSWGDGRKKNTVHHILCLEDFKNGKLERENFDFLCTSKSGTNGKLWGEPTELAYTLDGQAYQPKISCKQCLKIANNLLKNNKIKR